jgi:hypothetical protein
MLILKTKRRSGLYMSNPDCKDLVNSSKERDCCGLREILAVILKLQENADKFDPILATCDRPFLGPEPDNKCFNTRPVVLYNDEFEEWAIPIEEECPHLVTPENDVEETENNNGDSIDLSNAHSEKRCPPKLSTVFRLEKLGPCTATFRVLIPIRKGYKCEFKKTDVFFTVNLCCICAIRCLDDTFVAGVC